MNSFDDILAICLDDLLAGRATVDDCLRRYPEQAPELRPLLTIAQAVQSAPAVEPPPLFAAAAPARLQNIIAQQPAAPQRRWQWPRVFRLRVAAAMLILSLALGGTAYAARDSQVDSPLYPVKTTVERMKLAAVPDKQKAGRMFMATINARAREVVVSARKGSARETMRSAREYTLLTRDLEGVARKLPLENKETRDILLGLRAELTEQQAQFQRLRTEAPPAARPGVLQALQAALHAIQIISGRLQEAPHAPPGVL